MDFIEINFGDCENKCFEFVQLRWDFIFNVFYVANPDPGQFYGWTVRYCGSKIRNKG